MKKYLPKEKRAKLIKSNKSEQERKAGDRIKAVLLDDDGWSYRHIV